MNFAQALNAALPLAAVLVPAFVVGFGAIWLAMHNGFAQIRVEIADLRRDLADLRGEMGELRKELYNLSERVQRLAERVSRIEGRLDPQHASGPTTPPVPAGE